MTGVSASAPGKLVLLGEYAVLEGAPALAVAVDRRARVRVRPRADGQITVHAPQLDAAAASARIDAHGRLQWQCADALAHRLQLVAKIWDGLAQEGLLTGLYSGCELEIDTAGFVLETPAGRRKLGLGSSAALTVALASALARAAGHAALLADRSAWLARLVRMHSDWQHGQGSGVDIAASLVGGAITYRRGDHARALTVVSCPWPPADTHWLWVWSGQAVSTGGFLQRLGQWREACADAYAQQMQRLDELAQTAIAAMDGDASRFVAGVAAYSQALADFAAASGLAIFSPAQRQLAQLAVQQGAAFKPCGAGGDIGVVVADSQERLAMLRRSIMAAGLQPLALEVDPCGLQFAPSSVDPESPAEGGSASPGLARDGRRT